MTLEADDLPDLVTIVHRPAAPTRDTFGNPVVNWAAADRDENVPASFQPAGADEDTGDSDRTLIRPRLFLMPGVTIGPYDRVEHLGVTYEVTGPPERWRSDGTEHHVEVTLTHVDA